MLRAQVAVGVAAVILATACASLAEADVIRLRGGGEMRGVLLDDPTRRTDVQIQTANAWKPFVIGRDRLLEVVPERSSLDEYLPRRREVEATAQANYDLGQWCEARKLPGPAEYHYRRAVEIDKSFGPAHEELGHVLVGDDWLTVDEARKSAGLVKYKGKWISGEEKQRLDSVAAASAEEVSWLRRLKLIRQKLRAGSEAERAEAEQQLAEIKEPAAIRALVETFAQDDEASRVRAARIISGISDPKATDALIRMVMFEEDPSTRLQIVNELAGRKDLESVTKLTRILAGKNPLAAGRAASALAALDARSAVPKMIAALVKVEQRMVMVPGDPGVPQGDSYSFITPQAPTPMAASDAAGLGGFVTGRGYSIPLLTPPAVGPGAVAFGGTSIPFGYGGVLPYGYGTGGVGPAAGISAGGAMSTNPHRPQASVVTLVHRNQEVHTALVKLTSVDFGYDADAWRRWLRTEFRPDTAPGRRVPQP